MADKTTVMRYAGMYSLIVRPKLALRIKKIGRVTVVPLQESSALAGTNVCAAGSVTMPASIHTQTTLQRT
jgi:3-dehydroquinate synthase class II